MRSTKTFLILIELVNAQWAADVATDAAKRQAVVEAVLHSEKTKTDGNLTLSINLFVVTHFILKRPRPTVTT